MTTITSVDLSVRDSVVFVDSFGKEHPALITAIHGETSLKARNEKNEKWMREAGYSEESIAASMSAPFIVPSVNVVYVVDDEGMTDTYGRQISRATSVPHVSYQTAHGMYYAFPLDR